MSRSSSLDSTSSEERRLKCLATSSHFGRKLSRRFSLTDELLEDGRDQPDSVLLRMPHEVQMLVYETLGDAPSQVALALTCKQMAQIASHVNLSRAYVSPKYAGLLPKEVFDVPSLMRQLVGWMPTHLRLCDHCLTNRPADSEYWKSVPECDGSSYWVQKVGWSFSDASWHKQMHNICPACHLTCSLSDYVDCDGCRALGRLGDIDWARVSGHHRRRTELELRASNYAT